MDVEIGEKAVVGPRQRLEDLYNTARSSSDFDGVEHEIFELARAHPEVFVADINMERRGEQEDRRSPLICLMSIMQRQRPVSIDTFEAVYVACPTAINSRDSWGDTVLTELLGCLYCCNFHDQALNDAWFDLLKAVINKSQTLLTIM